ncbi:MAG: hypothetical protein ACTSYS_12260 [Promethearchaeota archaeon]
MPSFEDLEKAKALGCNLFITHEPLFIGAKNLHGVWIGGPVKNFKQIGKIGIPLEQDDVWNQKYSG